MSSVPSLDRRCERWRARVGAERSSVLEAFQRWVSDAWRTPLDSRVDWRGSDWKLAAA